MPRKQPAASPASRTFTRRVRSGGGASFTVRRPGPSGEVVEVIDFAAFGDEVTTDALSMMALDSVGALAEPGATREDVEAELQRSMESYRAARRSVSGIV